MTEAQRLSSEGKFDDAYDYFVRLRAEHPNFPGLEAAIADYLQRNALAAIADRFATVTPKVDSLPD